MDKALARDRIEATLEESYGHGVHVQECAEVPGVGANRIVHKLTVKTPDGDTQSLFAKTGTDSQVRVETALYQRVLGAGITHAPAMIAATVANGVHCFITEESVGNPLDETNEDHVIAAFRALAQLHREGRSHVETLTDIFAGPASTVTHFADPRDMFARIFKIWGLATALGITHEDLAVFYDQRALDLVLNEPPTLVHGDFGPHNLLIDPATLDIRFIDFGFGEVRAASSDLMYEFNSGDTFGDHLHAGLHAYWEASDQGVPYEVFRLRQAYWHASYYADVFSWQLTKEDLADEDLRDSRLRALERIREGGRFIAKQLETS